MTKKVQKILLIIFLSALIIALMAASFLYASTYGRYSGGALSDDSTYDDTIEFIGTERYVVRTPEELNDAIENGYSYIQIADDAEQPFVITTDVQDVSTNLVLDLNGTVVVRNSRNPMLNVSQGVSVVLVYDSSEEHAGAFYNPVGSALQVSGGTMTIGSGNYESGPRTNEYADATAAGTLSPQTDDIVLFSRGGVTSPATVDRVNGTTFSPVTIAENTSYVPATTGNYYYQSEADSGYSFLTEDTFLIYTLEEGEIAGEDSSFGKGTLLVDGRPLAVPCNVASCDFYYYYATGDKAEDGTDIYAVVYGYWDVKELAEQGSSLESAGLQWPYAAIRMTAGEGFVRGGNFVNQFDVANTYGILTEENSKDGATGSLVVSETGRAGTTNFTARGEAVCIGCWEGDVAISGGNFSSELGNTIVMSGGELNITAGNFNKNVQASAKEGNGAAISMQDGALTIAGTQTDNTKSVQFTVTGSSVNGIEAQGGTINAKNASFMFENGQNNTGISTDEVGSTGCTVDLTGCTFDMPGNSNRGISSESGAVSLSDCNVTIKGNDGYGIYAEGGTIVASGVRLTLEGSGNHGVSASVTESVEQDYDITISDSAIRVGSTASDSGNFGIRLANGYMQCNNLTLDVYGSASAGILATVKAAASGRANVVLTGTYRGTIYQSGTTELSSAVIMLQGGSIDLQTTAPTDTDEYNITSDGLGIVVDNGSMTQTSGGLSINTTRGTAIYLRGGSLTQESDATLSVTSTIVAGTSWAQEEGASGGAANIYNGVYVTNGSLIANGSLNVTHMGVANDQEGYVDDTWKEYDYEDQVIKSYAVRVEGTANTSVTINAGEIKNSVGGGLYVSGIQGQQVEDIANLTFDGIDQSSSTIVDLGGVTIKTTGVGDRYSKNIQSNWGYYLSTAGGHAVEIDGGVLHVSNGTYTAQQGDGIRIQGGIAFIENGYFVGQDNGAYLPGAGASYAFKVYGGYAKVEGGTFGQAYEGAASQGNGAFVMQGDAYITKATIHAGGTTGFGVWTNANVTFAPNVNSNNEIDNDAIYVYGASTGLTLENGGSHPKLQVTINGGTFEAGDQGTPYGIWYGNGNATLTITGGTFTGDDAGLRIAANPGQIRYDRQYNAWPPEFRYTWRDERNIHISGGTFSSINDGVGGLRVCDILDCEFNEPEGGYNTSSSISNVTDDNGINVSGAWNGVANEDTGINSSLSRGEVIVEKS